jgi:RHS repeat-associated protein
VTVTAQTLVVATFRVPPPQVSQYYHLDVLGSVRAVSGDTGTVIRRHDYAAFGEDVAEIESQALPPLAKQQRFTGKERDVETAFDYFGARYYRNVWGRFTTVDPVLNIDAALTDPQRWNRYAYAKNSPLVFIDPDGAEITTPAGFFTKAFQQQNAANLQALGKVLVNIGRSINSPGHMTPDAELQYFEQPDSRKESNRMHLFDLMLSAAPLVGLRGGSAVASTSLAEEIGILRDAARGRGNFGLGSATADDAARLGRAWVGEGYKVASDGKTLISRDGLRQYRPPSFKPALNRFQANFEQRPEPFGGWGSNGHLEIIR